MAKMNWNRVRPTSLSHAMELCIEFGRQKKNLSVDRIADRMGLANKWTLYKWIENGRMPAILIPTFEHACGANYMTTYLATAAHKLLIDIPSGKRPSDTDIISLNANFNDAVSLLSRFYKGDVQVDQTINALTNSITEIAFHRENIQKDQMPELDLSLESDDE